MNSNNAVASKNVNSKMASNLLTIVGGLWDQVDFAFPEVTSSQEWKDMTKVERNNARREMFRLLHGNSPEVLAMRISQIGQKMEEMEDRKNE